MGQIQLDTGDTFIVQDDLYYIQDQGELVDESLTLVGAIQAYRERGYHDSMPDEIPVLTNRGRFVMASDLFELEDL